MMILKSLNETRTAVFLTLTGGDGEETVALSPGEWKRFRIRRPLEPLSPLSEDDLADLRAAAERSAALREAARMLGVSDKSARELKRRLRAARFSDEASDHAVSFLTEKGYLNEADACRRFAETAVRMKHYGRLRIREALAAKGYPAELSAVAAEEIPDEEYRDALRAQIRRRCPDFLELDPAGRQKAAAALYRLGFTREEIRAALRQAD